MNGRVHPPLAPHNHQPPSSTLCPLETTRTELFLVGFIHQSVTNGVLGGMLGPCGEPGEWGGVQMPHVWGESDDFKEPQYEGRHGPTLRESRSEGRPSPVLREPQFEGRHGPVFGEPQSEGRPSPVLREPQSEGRHGPVFREPQSEGRHCPALKEPLVSWQKLAVIPAGEDMVPTQGTD